MSAIQRSSIQFVSIKYVLNVASKVKNSVKNSLFYCQKILGVNDDKNCNNMNANLNVKCALYNLFRDVYPSTYTFIETGHIHRLFVCHC